MLRKTLFLVGVLLLFLVPTYADTNGIWVEAKDIRSGTFGSDEGGGNFVFPNNLQVGTLFQTNQARVSGNLGVGISTPQDRLHVYDSSDVSIIVDTQSSSAASYLSLRQGGSKVWSVGQNPTWSSGSNDFYIYDDGSLSGSTIDGLVVKKSTGYVGVGTTSPNSKLDVLGGIRSKKGDAIAADASNVGFSFEGDGDTGMFAIGGTPIQNSDLIFKVDGDEVVRVTDVSTRVGISTSTPTQKLDVNGNTRIRNNLYTNGNIYSNGAMYENGARIATRNYVDSKVGGSTSWSDMPSGSWCGMSSNSPNINHRCQGSLPEYGCPSGFSRYVEGDFWTCVKN